MARYIREAVINQPVDFVNCIMNDFLTKHGFSYVEFKGEMIYRSGAGVLTIPQFFKWFYQNGVIHVEAWTRSVWIPGVYGKENALNGFYGALPKSIYKGHVDDLMQLLYQYVPPVMPQQGMPMMQSQGMPQQGMPQQGMPQQPIMIRGVDTSRYGTYALILGIIGIVTSWLCAGIFFDILGIIYAMKAKDSAKSGSAIAGLICSIIGLVFTFIFMIIGVLFA